MRGRRTRGGVGLPEPDALSPGRSRCLPFAYAVYLSMTTAQVGVPGHFVGLGNYRRLLDIEIFT